MTTKNRYTKRAKITEAKFRLLIRYFSHDLEAKTIAALTGLNRNTVNRYLTLIRKRIAEFCEHHSPVQEKIAIDVPWGNGTLKLDNTGIQAYQSAPVFGVFKHDGKVYTEIVPDCPKTTLQAMMNGQNTPEGLNFSKAWRRYDSLVALGYKKHYRVSWRMEGAVHERCHSDCIESFLAFAKNRLGKFHGIAGSTFYLHLKECEFRFDYHDRDLCKMLLKMLRSNPLS